MIPFYLKKWYFDFIGEGCQALYLYFITARIAGMGQGMVSAHLTLPDGKDIRASAKTRFANPRSDLSLNLAAHSVRYSPGQVDVLMKFENLEIQLCYSTRVGPWRPAEGGMIWEKKKKYLRWLVPQPEASVEGSLSYNSKKIKVSGRGYQDIVETNLAPWKIPIAELLWGRAHCGNYGVVFNQITTAEGQQIQNLMLEKERRMPTDGQTANFSRNDTVNLFGSCQDQSFFLTRDPSDTKTTLVHKSFSLILSHRTILEESPIVTSERFKSGFSRRLLERTCGSPLEKKMVSDALLMLDGETFYGTALHERVTWDWKKGN